MPAVRAELESMLAGSPHFLEAAIRPGCVHMDISAIVVRWGVGGVGGGAEEGEEGGAVQCIVCPS